MIEEIVVEVHNKQNQLTNLLIHRCLNYYTTIWDLSFIRGVVRCHHYMCLH